MIMEKDTKSMELKRDKPIVSKVSLGRGVVRSTARKRRVILFSARRLKAYSDLLVYSILVPKHFSS